jgi:inner membrane protein
LEPITHFLYGATMSRAAFHRKTGLATLTMTLAAEAPDIDMLWYFRGSAAGFVHHRGWTHTVFGIPFVAALVLVLVFILHYFYRRFRPMKTRPDSSPPWALPRWGLLYGLACFAGYSHLLLDFTNNYGIRPLWPLWNHWIAWDTVFIIDPIILAFLFLGLLLPALFGLVNQEIGARSRGPHGRGGAITALILVALFWGFRDYQHRRAVAAIDAMLYHDRPPSRIAAFPYQLSPFQWHGVAETELTYESVTVSSSTPEVDPQGTEQTFFRPADTEVIRAAKASFLGGAFMDWARFPTIEVEKRVNPTLYVVSFRDVRFAYPERRSTPLSAYVVLDHNLKAVDQGLYARNPVKNRMESTTPEEEQHP